MCLQTFYLKALPRDILFIVPFLSSEAVSIIHSVCRWLTLSIWSSSSVMKFCTGNLWILNVYIYIFDTYLRITVFVSKVVFFTYIFFIFRLYVENLVTNGKPYITKTMQVTFSFILLYKVFCVYWRFYILKLLFSYSRLFSQWILKSKFILEGFESGFESITLIITNYIKEYWSENDIPVQGKSLWGTDTLATTLHILTQSSLFP